MSILAHSLDTNRTKDVTLDGNVNFESLLLNKFVLNGLAKSGFKKPSPVQVKAIPVGRCGFDLIVRSKSGTGKTLVYAVVALEIVDISKNDTEVLIIVPTREIVVQIEEVLLTIGSYMEGLQVKSFIGGFPLDADREKCKICHIAIGTPGRIKHLITEGILKTDSIRLFVLDEVDKLMEFSFLNDINEIYNNLTGRTQIITTTATYTDELKGFLQKYMLSPIYIEIQSNTQFLWGLKQYVVVVKQHSNVVQQMKFKTEEILKIFSNISFTQCIIFTNYQIRAESISNTLNQRGWTSTYVSAARTQAERLAAVKDLRIFNCKIMLSTDLTARGIDAANIDMVINYDVPVDATTYLHRMGRAGRYGSSGICINVVSEGKELQQIQSIFDRIGGSSLCIPELPKFNGTMPNLVNVLSKHYVNETPNKNACNYSDLNVKKEIFNLRNIKYQSTETNIITKFSEKCDIIERDINVILSNTKSYVEFINKQLCFEDTNTFLKSIALGEFKVKSDINCHNIAFYKELQQLILFNKWEPSNRLHDNEVNSVVSESDHSKTVQKFSTKEMLCHMNKALLCVSTIISDKNDQVQNNDSENHLDCIEIYLKILKEHESKEIENTLSCICQNGIEILKNIDHYKQNLDDTNSVTNIDLENIFQKAYYFATKPISRHWRVYCPESQIRLQKWPLKHSDNIDEYYMEEITPHKLDSDLHDGDAEDRTENVMKWIPVEQSEKSEKVPVLGSDDTCWEHFYKYFSSCSEYLWQNGLSFENVEDFDNWFCYDWQVYVSAVRNYIQQNIYIQEMNKHKESQMNII